MEKKNYFENQYQHFIFTRTYSRFNYALGRRETWEETVDRYFEFFKKRIPIKDAIFEKCKEYVLSCKVMPSMRALWSCGEALEKDNCAVYNCSYVVIDKVRSFSEMMYLLMCGCGVGFSVERQYVTKLPNVPLELKELENSIIVEDSRVGWATAFNEVLTSLYDGLIPKIDYSQVRSEGAILKTFGGRASGPAPLKRLIESTIQIFRGSRGRKLNSIECHDISCMIADAVVSGGVRRSSTISLSNLSDQRMKHAKDGAFWETHSHRMLANNSVAYTEKPDITIFMEEWLSLAKSGSGERGIFNREGCETIVARNGRRKTGYEWGCNPCVEIILRPEQFCNLTEVIVRSTDTLRDLLDKVQIATIMGMFQATLTDFRYLQGEWSNNCKEESLLGVSLTGVCDHPVLNDMSNLDRISDWLATMKSTAIKTATELHKKIGINMPAAITCVKPSGTVSQLVNSSSGLHRRHSLYYIRRVRISKTDPLCTMLIDQGVPWNPEVGYSSSAGSTLVFDFPLKSPRTSKFRDESNALEQLEHWKLFQENWCEHKPSLTVYVKEHEWLEVGAWVYKNWDLVSGVSFLPYDAGLYQLAPYEEITKEQYDTMVSTYPVIDFSLLDKYEAEDNTIGSKEYACVGDRCELV